MKDYYSILGLPTTASDAVIKRQYRKLALQYHPDKNKSPEAAQIIQEVNEAYDVLSDPQKRTQYDQLLSGQYVIVPPVPETPRHRDPRYRPKSAEYVRKSRENSFYMYMKQNLKYMVLVSKCTLAFTLFCLTDFVLPSVKEVHQILYTSKTVNAQQSQESRGEFVLYLENGSVIQLSHDFEENFLEGDKVDFNRSRVLSVPVRLLNQRTGFSTRVPLSFFGNFFFFPIILFFTSALGIFFNDEGTEFKFNVGLFNLIFFFFNLYFLNVHRF
ncbi:MAG: J domain-containing protein [Flammeovirgaceae bacterium]